MEFANILHGFGSQVTLIYRGELFLRGFELECREIVAAEMRKAGIDVRFKTNITKVEKNADGSYLSTFTDGSTITTDKVEIFFLRIASHDVF